MSEEVLGERLRADEATTTLALQHRTPISFSREDFNIEKIEEWALSIIRSGAIYVIDRDELTPAWNTLWDVPVEELPPLPFPRLVLEAEYEGKPCKFQTSERDERNLTFKLVEILEVDRGREWNICFVVELDNERQEYFVFGAQKSETRDGIATIFPVAFLDYYDITKEKIQIELRVLAGLLLRYVVNSIHLITARNTPKVRLDLPRAQRRQFQQKHGIEHPTVYRVKLDQAGEQEGTSGWHLSVRFLVRGHWRHFDNGSRTWISPYIKGPAGAPWKGRPIHATRQES